MGFSQPRTLGRLALWLGLSLIGASSALAFDDASPLGEKIYREKCASCHGAKGEGAEDYPKPLIGDRTVAQLARYIAKSMPSDEPGTVVGPDADAVALYVHDSFYSATAQARNAPPRIELSRLTVRQYRNVLTDLIGSFGGQGNWGAKRGLKAEYFKNGRMGERLFERVDPTVQFDFGVEGPEPTKFEPSRFSIRWQGAVLAPETGEYEFTVNTEHATRLWVNDDRTPLIDAWVKSGSDTAHRATIFLLGGRSYPIRLEFSKAKQGVDDSKNSKRKPPPVKASISLEWTLPRRSPEVIPDRNLSPEWHPALFVSTTPFPADDRSIGYERGTSVSKAWDQATTDAAIEVASYVTNHLRDLAGTKDDAPDREAKLREFSQRFVERAFRRPLTDEQKAIYIDRQFTKARDPVESVKRVVLLTMKSPRFLYREPGVGQDPYDVASRLSFALWDTSPDRELLEAAASGRLNDRESVSRQAERMLPDPRTKSKLREFFFRWLRVDSVPELSKNTDLFPGFDPSLASDLRTSLDLALEEAIWDDASDFRRLMLSDEVYLNGRLASFYNVEMMPDAPFQKVRLDPQARAGVLTHPYLMSSFAYTSTSSPIHRGVFLSRSVLGRTLRPPPEAFAPLSPDLHPSLSTRERVALQTSPRQCMNCHGMINPLGFGFENFDAVGRFRAEEKGRTIDATGLIETRDGGSTAYNGARELAEILVRSEEVQTAFVEQLFHHLVKQPIRAYGPDRTASLHRSFRENRFHIRKLVAEIATTSALAAPASQGVAAAR